MVENPYASGEVEENRKPLGAATVMVLGLLVCVVLGLTILCWFSYRQSARAEAELQLLNQVQEALRADEEEVRQLREFESPSVEVMTRS